MSLRILFLIALSLLPLKGRSQASLDSVFTLPDSVYIFTMENFYYLIRQNHPVLKQVDMLSDFARQEIRLARGNFDPKVEASLLKKNYKGTTYYDLFDAAIKVPTIFPVDPTIGIERNRGAYVNPENYLSPNDGYKQFYAGVSIPLGRGLFTDDRRAALRQAELFSRLTEADQIKITNKILLDAAKDYWQWFYAYYNYRLMSQSMEVAERVFKIVKVNSEMGEVAPIDTVQAKITWEQRVIDQREAWLDFVNTGLILSNYLWDSIGNPQVLPLYWAPASDRKNTMISVNMVEELMASALERHPDLLKIRIKTQQLEVERRLAAEFLKPRLNLTYYLLNQPLNGEGDYTAPDFNDNYKFGLDFSFPLFLRKERAKLAMTKLKIDNNLYEETLAERTIQNDLKATYNILINNQQLIQVQSSMVQNYERLLNAEFLNIENGESDLFKINIQQEKLITTQTKLLKLLAEYEKQKSVLFWVAGVRNLTME